MIITILLLCIFLIFLCHYLIHHGKFWQLIDQIPGPPPLLLIGNTLLWCTNSLEDLLRTFEYYLKVYYPVVKWWCFNYVLVGISHPDDVEKILSSSKEHIGKGFLYTFMQPWLGTGLITSEGTKWHARRKILTPAFHINILKQHVTIMIEESNYMIQCLKENKKLIVNDLFSLVSHHALNVICETAMGISLKDKSELQQQYLKKIHEINQLILTRVIKPWLYPDIIFALSSMGRRQARSLKILHGFTDQIIAERKKYHKNTNGQYLKQFENNFLSNEETLGVPKRRLAMLDILIAMSYDGKINDLDIREEVDTFIAAGHDTVAISICFTILLLAEHKNIQDRVRSEVSAVMLENNGKLNMKALNNMPYLERCLKESLRLYPSVPFIVRVTSEDVKIQSYIVPSGTMLLIPIRLIQRNPEFWPNPDIFDPDRFLPENSKTRHPFSYIPFSTGPRNCIGQRYAMLELKAIIASLVHNFYLEPVDYLKHFRFEANITLRVVHPVRVKFIPIEQIQSKTN